MPRSVKKPAPARGEGMFIIQVPYHALNPSKPLGELPTWVIERAEKIDLVHGNVVRVLKNRRGGITG